MRKIEVFVADGDGSMMIFLEGDQKLHLSAEEVAYLSALMAQADKTYRIVNDEEESPDAPLTQVRASKFR